ncbi:Sn1-specific diacylglycerol lipase alpha [Acrasis kona]|uniref:sn-1-specific diacylglycerol lipase n=1 Tax=Acrasis kona TaxID=1008807 RepID=A0AAW2ZAM2_9EUKA
MDQPVLQSKHYQPSNGSPTNNGVAKRLPPPPPAHLLRERRTSITENNERKSADEDQEPEYVLQGHASDEAIQLEEKQPSLMELITKTAECMKEAFPSYSELTVGDLSVGLAGVAVEHKKQNALNKLHESPCLFQIEQSDHDFLVKDKKSPITAVNPEGVDTSKILLANRLVNYAMYVYYPIVEPELEKEETKDGAKSPEPKDKAEAIVEDPEQPKKHYVLMGQVKDVKDAISAETITKKKEHVNLRAHLIEDLVQFRCESGHMQNAFFTKIDYKMNALIISVRGTDSSMDAFTNATANPINFSAHKQYPEHCEEMVEGVVHKGKLEAAKWVLSQNEAIIKEIFFKSDAGSETNNKKQKIERIYFVGHSLGGSVATLTGILAREFFHEHRSSARTLPPIKVVTFACSCFSSYNISRWCRGFVDTWVIGGDIVPRMSPGQAERLRLEIQQCNWENKVDSFLKQHSNIAAAVNMFNSYLENKGYITLLKNKQQQQQMDSTQVHTNQEGNTIISETTNDDSSTDQTDKQQTNYEIETLYPPGNIYLLVEDQNNEQAEKDFGSMLITFLESKFKDEEKEAESPMNSPVTVTSLVSSWWSAGKETKKPTKKIEKIEKGAVVVAVQDERRQFVMRHVDAKHFDRIILNPGMFKDHRLVNFHDALLFMEEATGLKEKSTTKTLVRIAPLPNTNTTLLKNYS